MAEPADDPSDTPSVDYPTAESLIHQCLDLLEESLSTARSALDEINRHRRERTAAALERRRFSCRGSKEAKLTHMEVELIRALITPECYFREPQSVSRVCRAVYEASGEQFTESLRKLRERLQKKLFRADIPLIIRWEGKKIWLEGA